MQSIDHKIRIFDDAEALSRAAADTIVKHIADCLQTRNNYSIALSGGHTPQLLFSLLANDAALRASIPWERIHFFWGDERGVPPVHPESNYRSAYDALLSKVPVPATNIHRIHAEDADADKAAADYEIEIRRFFGIEAGQIPRFSCVLLGMGTDGHTASLFPGTAVLAETRRLVAAYRVKKIHALRFTLTLPVFNHADQILFLVSGVDKADTLKAVLEGDRQPDRYPAQRIRPCGGKLIWFLDRAAASRLSPLQNSR